MSNRFSKSGQSRETTFSFYMCKANLFTYTICIVILSVFVLLSAGCGIPSYPYLYPPEPVGVNGEVKFKHNPKNGNPEQMDVFRGYEIFYRFYTENPNAYMEENKTRAEKDMETYFTSSLLFRSVIYEESGSAYNFGFRRLLIDINNDNTVSNDSSPPQLDIDDDYYGDSFAVEITSNSADDLVYLSLSYDAEKTYTVYRTAVDGQEKNKEFYPFSDYIIEGDNRDSDIVDQQNITQDILDDYSLYVAFFAIPFGIDSVTPIYANGSYEGMAYIGSFKL